MMRHFWSAWASRGISASDKARGSEADNTGCSDNQVVVDSNIEGAKHINDLAGDLDIGL